MISAAVILIPLAAICKAVADTVNHHYSESVFAKMNPRFWSMAGSSEHARRIGGYKVDAWHLANSAMIILMVCAAIFHRQTLPWYCELAIGWPIWNFPFNIFYNRILRRK